MDPFLIPGCRSFITSWLFLMTVVLGKSDFLLLWKNVWDLFGISGSTYVCTYLRIVPMSRSTLLQFQALTCVHRSSMPKNAMFLSLPFSSCECSNYSLMMVDYFDGCIVYPTSMYQGTMNFRFLHMECYTCMCITMLYT